MVAVKLEALKIVPSYSKIAYIYVKCLVYGQINYFRRCYDESSNKP